MWEIGGSLFIETRVGRWIGKLGERRHTHPRATRAEMLCSLPWAPPCEPPQWSCQAAHLQDPPEAAGLGRRPVAEWASALCSEQPATTAPLQISKAPQGCPLVHAVATPVWAEQLACFLAGCIIQGTGGGWQEHDMATFWRLAFSFYLMSALASCCQNPSEWRLRVLLTPVSVDWGAFLISLNTVPPPRLSLFNQFITLVIYVTLLEKSWNLAPMKLDSVVRRTRLGCVSPARLLLSNHR